MSLSNLGLLFPKKVDTLIYYYLRIFGKGFYSFPFVFLATKAMVCFFLGRTLPKEPLNILPRLVLLSPRPMMLWLIYVNNFLFMYAYVVSRRKDTQ